MLALWEINQVFQYRAEAEGPCGQPREGQAGREPQLSCATSEKTATCHNLSPKKQLNPEGAQSSRGALEYNIWNRKKAQRSRAETGRREAQWALLKAAIKRPRKDKPISVLGLQVLCKTFLEMINLKHLESKLPCQELHIGKESSASLALTGWERVVLEVQEAAGSHSLHCQSTPYFSLCLSLFFHVILNTHSHEKPPCRMQKESKLLNNHCWACFVSFTAGVAF